MALKTSGWPSRASHWAPSSDPTAAHFLHVPGSTWVPMLSRRVWRPIWVGWRCRGRKASTGSERSSKNWFQRHLMQSFHRTTSKRNGSRKILSIWNRAWRCSWEILSWGKARRLKTSSATSSLRDLIQSHKVIPRKTSISTALTCTWSRKRCQLTASSSRILLRKASVWVTSPPKRISVPKQASLASTTSILCRTRTLKKRTRSCCSHRQTWWRLIRGSWICFSYRVWRRISWGQNCDK